MDEESTVRLSANPALTQSPSPTFLAESPENRETLHVLTLTPFFPFLENPVYGTYISEPIEHFPQFNLRSTVIAVSPLHHRRHFPAADAAGEWLRYPTIPGNLGLTTAGFFLYRRLLSHVRRVHQRSSIHVLHAHAALPCGHAAWLLAKTLRIPFVVTVHGLDVFNTCSRPGTAPAIRRLEVSTEIYRRAAAVICVSRRVQDLLRQGVKRLPLSRVVYNGTDPDRFSPSETTSVDRAPNILMVGNLIQSKGQEIAFRALAQIAPQFPDLTCTLIGEGRDQQRLMHLCRNLGISGRVTFLGRQDRRAVANAIRRCTVFALPSRFEGLGCAYLEAMACARPVIACEGQGIAEIIKHGENGWLIPVDGIAEMADALRVLLSSPTLRANIGTSARTTILDGLTLTDQARHLNDLYREVARI